MSIGTLFGGLGSMLSDDLNIENMFLISDQQPESYIYRRGRSAVQTLSFV